MSHRNYFHFVLLGLSLMGFSLGCKPPSSAENSPAQAEEQADEHAGHDHGHGEVGPHGGHFLHLEPDGTHAEWTHDDDAKLVTVYLDEMDAKAVKGVKFTVKVGDAPAEEFALTRGDEGWTISDETLMTHLNMGEAAEVQVVVDTDSGSMTAHVEHEEHEHHH